MRNNQPVTTTEYKLNPDHYLISRTDLKGRITYANRAFIEVSGFPEEELIGAPHNLVRHPDMPPEAFADLWKTVQAGKTWSGFVKNRRKSGDYYWVSATVTPTQVDGQVVGYTSVRSMATQAQIDRATQIYTRFREGRARGLAIREGAVVRRGPGAIIDVFSNLTIQRRIFLSQAAPLACFAALAAVLWGLVQWRGYTPSVNEMLAWLLGTLGVATLVSAIGGSLLARRLVSPLRQTLDFALRLGAGDLSTSLRSGMHDEVGKLMAAMNTMQRSLMSVVGDIQKGAGSVSTATSQIAAGNLDLSQRTEEQASSLEQTASSMEQLTSIVRQNTDNARQASGLAVNASQIAMKGGEVVGRVVGTMADINDSSRKIVDIIGVIEGIAFQTNILALNAAVEAARAGEQGRGFAVVAGEVRSLAQRSAEAAKEIKALINDSVSRVENGTQLVDQAGRTMDEIVEAVKRVTDIMGEISAASEEQSSGIEQVNQAVTQMDQVTQQNAALVEEAAAAAESLNEQSVRLKEAIAAFRVDRHAVAPSVSAKPDALPGARQSGSAALARKVVAKAQATVKPAPAASAAATAADAVSAVAATPVAPAIPATVATSAAKPRALKLASTADDEEWTSF